MITICTTTTTTATPVAFRLLFRQHFLLFGAHNSYHHIVIFPEIIILHFVDELLRRHIPNARELHRHHRRRQMQILARHIRHFLWSLALLRALRMVLGRLTATVLLQLIAVHIVRHRRVVLAHKLQVLERLHLHVSVHVLLVQLARDVRHISLGRLTAMQAIAGAQHLRLIIALLHQLHQIFILALQLTVARRQLQDLELHLLHLLLLQQQVVLGHFSQRVHLFLQCHFLVLCARVPLQLRQQRLNLAILVHHLLLVIVRVASQFLHHLLLRFIAIHSMAAATTTTTITAMATTIAITATAITIHAHAVHANAFLHLLHLLVLLRLVELHVLLGHVLVELAQLLLGAVHLLLVLGRVTAIQLLQTANLLLRDAQLSLTQIALRAQRLHLLNEILILSLQIADDLDRRLLLLFQLAQFNLGVLQFARHRQIVGFFLKIQTSRAAQVVFHHFNHISVGGAFHKRST
mmetsp:Transcript_40377/g.66330  ORF Transcript_40377/g.66330 Transcript_40377/m.66330 type:complete len:464 (-) Transcript_40377:22-1413(-)